MPINIGFVLFPNVTQLDFTGPLQVLGRLPDAEVHIAAKSMDPVQTDSVLKLLPTTTFADCPDLDLICVPGGFGVVEAMQDAETVNFVKTQGAHARWVTSVCTGTFVLGAAGLLEGKKATTHWAYTSLLPMVGATHDPARSVEDGNIMTAGGVTSGIDFAFRLFAEIAGENAAKSVQLGLEYDPDPPFRAGHPSTAPDGIKAAVTDRYKTSVEAYRAALS